MPKQDKDNSSISSNQIDQIDKIDKTDVVKVKGSVPPHGGKWKYDKETDELTLVEEPTKYD